MTTVAMEVVTGGEVATEAEVVMEVEVSTEEGVAMEADTEKAISVTTSRQVEMNPSNFHWSCMHVCINKGQCARQ